MKISIITVCYNSERTVAETVASVLGQTHPDVEYIIIDGASTDGTLEVLGRERARLSQLVSEPDKGIYDAMNKGLRLATGEVVGLLNSDDVYAHREVLSHVAECFKDPEVEATFGDLQFVREDKPTEVVRHWRSRPYAPRSFQQGWHPPHPTFFVRRRVYEEYGHFDTSLRIAADFEIMLRFIERYKIRTAYMPEVLVRMRMGGESTRSLGNIIRANRECYQAWKKNELPASPWTVLRKPLSKVGQLFRARGQTLAGEQVIT